jgi:hypothetical protein
MNSKISHQKATFLRIIHSTFIQIICNFSVAMISPSVPCSKSMPLVNQLYTFQIVSYIVVEKFVAIYFTVAASSSFSTPIFTVYLEESIVNRANFYSCEFYLCTVMKLLVNLYQVFPLSRKSC